MSVFTYRVQSVSVSYHHKWVDAQSFMTDGQFFGVDAQFFRVDVQFFATGLL